MRTEDDKIAKLDLSDEFLLSSAGKRYEEGNYLAALTMLNKRAERFEPSADASALYADIYESLGLYEMCADAWFRFLDTCNEADFGEGYEGLAVAFSHTYDARSAEYYYRLANGFVDPMPAEEEPSEGPKLTLLDSEKSSSAEAMQEMSRAMQEGDFDRAGAVLDDMPMETPGYDTCLCFYLMGLMAHEDLDEAERRCAAYLAYDADNVSVLFVQATLLLAKNRKEEAKELARRLYGLVKEDGDELSRLCRLLAHCEMHEQAFEKGTAFLRKEPYDSDMLWLVSVAALRTGRREEAIRCIERCTTVYPRMAIAQYFLEQLRGEDALDDWGYEYRLPERIYKEIVAFLVMNGGKSGEEATLLSGSQEVERYLRLAYDQSGSFNQKLQLLSLQAAVLFRCDRFVREVLLDYRVDAVAKSFLMRLLALRDEENSFGVISYNIYREYFTHKLEIGPRKRREFLNSFARVYADFYFADEKNEERIIHTAEEVYQILDDAGIYAPFDEENEMCAVLVRESRLAAGYHTLDQLANAYEANVSEVKHILNLLI